MKTRDNEALLHLLTPQPQQSFKMSSLFRVLSLLASKRKLFILGSIAMCIAALAALSGPYLLGVVVDKVFKRNDLHALYVITGIFAGVEILRLLCSYLQVYIFGRIGQSVMHDLRSKLYQRVFTLPISKINRLTSGEVVTRVTGDVAVLQQVFSAGVLSIIEKILIVTSILVAMLVLNIKLTLLALAPFPLLIVVAIFASKAAHKLAHLTRERGANATSFLSESLAAFRIIKSFTLEETISRRFKILSQGVAAANRDTAYANSVLHPTMTLVNAISIALLFWFGFQMVQSGEIQLGTLVTFLNYTAWIFWPILHVFMVWSTLVTGLAAAERVFDVLDWEVESDNVPLDQAPEHIKGKIEFKDVWFAYSEPDWILKGVSFVIEPGEYFGLIGATGSGKSTILSLLLGFYTPQKGEIFIDDKPISSYPLSMLRKAFGIVQQDVVLFSGNVLDNLTLGDSETLVTSKEQDILKRRGISLTDTISEMGRNLSEGQRQLVSFVRALIRNPSVWILDEATAHLDPTLDAELNSLVREFGGGASALVVAHRPSSVAGADRVLRMEQGHIV